MIVQQGLYVRAAIAASFIFSLTQAAPAFAQQAQVAGGLEEIVVTARKREELIQTIPLAITAFTSEDMKRRGAQDMNDIAQLTPGFNYTDYGGQGNTSPVIRGTTQIAGTGNAEQNVSFFLDGVYLARSYLTNLGLDGLDRVEVVAGPQSARYGHNAFMGAVNYVSRKPTDQWHAEVDGTVGIYSRYDAKGTISGPIVPGKVDVLGGVGYSTFDGSWVNPHPDCAISFGEGTNCRSGGWNKLTWNGAISVTPTDNLKVDFEYFHWKNRQEQRAFGWFGELGANSNIANCGQYNPNVRPLAAGGLGAGGQWYRLYCGQLPVINTPVDPRAYGQQLGASFMRGSVDWTITDVLKFEYVLGRVDATSLANQYTDVLPGCPWFIPAACVFQMGPNGTNESESHEARLTYDNGGVLRATVGMFYAPSRDQYQSSFGTASVLTAPPTSPLNPLVPSNYTIYAILINNLTKDKVYSPFGEVNLSLMDKRLRLSAEMRWTDDQKLQVALASGGLNLTSFAGKVSQNSFKSWTPRFTAEYDLTKDNLVYASAARGVKSGGFNPTAMLPQFQTYNSDSNWTYEVGSKNTFGNFRINGDVFYVKWKNMQITAADPSNPAPLPISITLNLGNMTSKGAELQGAWAPNKNVSFDATAYYGDPKYDQGTHDLNIARTPAICDNVVCPTNGDISGKMTPRASKLMGTFGAEYRGDIGGSRNMQYYARGELTYQSKSYVDEMDLSWVSARTLASVTLGLTENRYELQFWVRNLFDKVYIASGRQDAPNVNYYEALGDRRTLGITAKVKY